MVGPRARNWLALVLIAGVVLGAGVVAGRVATDVSAQQVGTVLPGNLSIRTNQTAYQIGDPITWCWTVPAAGTVTVIDINADGQQSTITGPQQDNGGGCASGTVVGPTGNECLQLDWSNGASESIRQTCFLVQGDNPPPPPPSRARIWTDTNQYYLGQTVHVCWSVPAPGTITVLLDPAGNAAPLPLASGTDSGGVQCTSSTVASSTIGTDCVTLDWQFDPQIGGAGAGFMPQSATSCYQVIGVYGQNCESPLPGQIPANCPE